LERLSSEFFEVSLSEVHDWEDWEIQSYSKWEGDSDEEWADHDWY
jgi:hypothetical protein